MDAFFAQVEERENPQFKGRSLVVGADPKQGKGRGVVSTSNYEARKFGIKSGMPISLAWRKNPQAVFLPVNMELYVRASEEIMNILTKYSRVLEKNSIDEAYLDVSEAGDYKKAEAIGKKIKEEIFKKEKLTCTVGIGPNKLIAKIACNQAKPNGLLAITLQRVLKFIGSFDIEELPGIGPKTAAKLRLLRVNTIKDIRMISRDQLEKMFGKVGRTLYERARGIDDDSVVTERIIKSIGAEYTFEEDTRDPEIIFTELEKLIAEVHHDLSLNKFSFKTITVVCRFSGFETHTKDTTLKEPSRDMAVLKKEAKRLFLKFFIENPKPIRLVGVRVKIH